jgi:hypothetical protein
MNVSPFAQKKRAAPAKAGFTPQGYTLFAVRYSVTGSRHPCRQKKYSGAHNRIYACVPLVVFSLYRFPFPFAKVIFHKKPVQNGG